MGDRKTCERLAHAMRGTCNLNRTPRGWTATAAHVGDARRPLWSLEAEGATEGEAWGALERALRCEAISRLHLSRARVLDLRATISLEEHGQREIEEALRGQ